MAAIDDFKAIANLAWAEPLPPIPHAIYDDAGLPILCRLCGQNRWLVERVLDDNTPIFVCNHGTAEGVIRQCDSQNGRHVWRVEALG